MPNDRKSPRTAEEQSSPEPERMVTPDEEAGMDLAELEEPPQAEGPRDLANGANAEEPLWNDRRRNEGAD
jgi:hypothetical protein